MTPIVDGIEEKFEEALAVRRINATEGDGSAVMSGYRIPGHPTLLIFDEAGNEVQRLVGVQPAENIEVVLALMGVE